MASSGFKIAKLVFNLILLGVIIVGAWIGYNKFIVGPKARAERTQEVKKHLGNAEWEDALAALDELEKEKDLQDFVKEKRLQCYTSMADEIHKKALSDESKVSKYKRRYEESQSKRDKERYEKYAKRSKERFQKCIDYLAKAEKYGKLKRLDIMNRSSSYASLGNKEEAKRWNRELKNYPE